MRVLRAPECIIRNPAYSPDGRHLVAVVGTPAQVWVWDTTATADEGTPRLLLKSCRVSQAVVRPGGRLTVIGGDRSQVLEADASAGPDLVGGHAGEIGCAAFSPDGLRMATGAGYKGRGEIRTWDATRWEKKP